ncbi:hypothetical protein DSM112329_02781 [Paraconexibacter sp. AEG42_29]|uniref:histidine kinase n=1 Tax=Paraconexibacter sp. AEG42_29 TaxID=2997339 RepID=A0AAU7AWA1_9ACTN
MTSQRLSIRRALPSGATLPDEEFARRHRLLTIVLWAHVPALFAFGLVQGVSPWHSTLEAAIVATPAALAQFIFTSRKESAALVAVGLITASAITVHLADGQIEAHFHFFVMIVALTLYEDWVAFGIAAAYVLVHHGLLGTLSPETVYSHQEAIDHPWRWAAIHAGFVAAAGAFGVMSWRLSEDARARQAEALTRTLVAEAEASATATDLARSNRDLERFAYVASHDLSEPLRTISSFMKLLDRRYGADLDDEGREYITWAVDGTQRMQAMIDDLLRFSRAGRLEPELRPIDLEALVADVVLGLRAQLEDADATVVVGSLPRVSADAAQVGQVVQNLIANAVKFAADRPPEIHIDGVTRDGRVDIAVEDNGIGIAPEYRDQVFEMFQRLHSRDDYPGSGIGLSVCQRVVERHGGQIRIETPDSGVGTRFVFSLAASA